MHQFRVDGISEIGRREHNEDSFWCSSFIVDGRPCAVACVCDGVGGLQNGKMTSQRMANTVKEYCLQYGTVAGVKDRLLAESKKVYQECQTTGEQSGTTCTLLFMSQGQWQIYHMGDSRAYKYDVQSNTPCVLTIDHTALNANKEKLQELESADPATDPMAEEKHRRAHYFKQNYKNKLTRCLGVMENPMFDEYTGNYRIGDRFLVCSDGFWHRLSAYDFNENVITNLKGLAEKFLSLGESDNMTAVLIEVEEVL